MDLVCDRRQHRTLADLLEQATAMTVRSVSGRSQVSSSADVITASVPAAKNPRTTTSTAYQPRGQGAIGRHRMTQR
jgi:hypothetical protein